MGTIPFKKLGAFFGATIVVIAGIFWIIGGGIWRADNELANKEIVPAEEIQREKVVETDTDGDGLKDWEETLWQTNPKDSDTDNDGTPDGDEVKENRNPTIPGPNDSLEKKQVNQNSGPDTSTESFFDDPTLNTTEAFSRDFFTQYISLRDRNLPANIQGSLYQGLINDAENNFQISEYTKKDLKTTNDNSSISITNYSKDVASIISKYSKHADFNEPLILQNALINKKPDDLKQLVEMSLVYESIVKEMLEVTVPTNSVEFHLSLVNNYAGVAAGVYKMSEAFNDPVGAMFAFKEAQLHIENLATIFEEILSLYQS